MFGELKHHYAVYNAFMVLMNHFEETDIDIVKIDNGSLIKDVIYLAPLIDENDFVVVPTVYSNILIRLFAFKKIDVVSWVQGDIVAENYLKYKNVLKAKLLQLIVDYAYSGSSIMIYVSEYMKKKYELRYNNTKGVVVPCGSDIKYNGSDKIKNSFVYIGGVSVWQKIDWVCRIMNNVFFRVPDATLYLYVRKKYVVQEVVDEFIDSLFHSRVIINELNDRVEVENALSKIEYGFVLREDNDVNNVSSPIKIAEYMACGIKPIISSSIKSVAKYLKQENIGYLVEDINCVDYDEMLKRSAVNDIVSVYNKYYESIDIIDRLNDRLFE